MKKIISLVLVLFIASKLFSQDSLPNFTLTERGNRVTISWKNPFQSLIQLNVQRSFDSLKNFSTIFSAPSPELPQNGYTDTRPATNRNYYRIFYVFQGGSYFFSKSKRATGTTTIDVVATNQPKDVPVSRDLTVGAFTNIVAGDKRMVTIKIKDTLFKQFSVNSYRNFKDSILRQTKDTLYAIDETTIGLSPFMVIEPYKASAYVYVTKEGYINVSVPGVNEKKYNVKFFEEDGTALFEIHSVKESPLILDKSIFVHAGWFSFELYEDNRLKEKNRLFVPKDF